jgi:hypothetical protein
MIQAQSSLKAMPVTEETEVMEEIRLSAMTARAATEQPGDTVDT